MVLVLHRSRDSCPSKSDGMQQCNSLQKAKPRRTEVLCAKRGVTSFTTHQACRACNHGRGWHLLSNQPRKAQPRAGNVACKLPKLCAAGTSTPVAAAAPPPAATAPFGGPSVSAPCPATAQAEPLSQLSMHQLREEIATLQQLRKQLLEAGLTNSVTEIDAKLQAVEKEQQGRNPVGL